MTDMSDIQTFAGTVTELDVRDAADAGGESPSEPCVASGDFTSVEEAARELIDDRITELELEGDDLAWAKPHVDEAIAAVDRGEFVTLVCRILPSGLFPLRNRTAKRARSSVSPIGTI